MIGCLRKIQMRRSILLGLLVTFACAPTGPAPATVVSAPAHDGFLTYSQDWARHSALGDLRQLPLSPNDVELRLWEGFGELGASGTILQRRKGQWRAFSARIGGRATTTSNPVDTLQISELSPVADLEAVWRSALKAGVADLPPSVPRKWGMMDGGTYVIEVRRGTRYRASVIEAVSPPEVEVDRQVQSIYAIVTNGLAPPHHSGRNNQQTYFEWQVEKPARMLSDGPKLTYPSGIKSSGLAGEVRAQFVVTKDGNPDVNSFKVLKSTNELFTQAVRDALPEMHFSPATIGGKPVNQLVQQSFEFAVP